MKTPAQLDREIAEALAPKKRADAGMITGELARSLPRFEFIARWLVYVTKKKANRGQHSTISWSSPR